MTLLTEARRHYERRQALAARAARQALLTWKTLEVANLSASYQVELLPRLLRTVTAAQLAAASMTDPYVDRVLTEQGVDVDGLEVNPHAFVGVASDGRPLGALLASPLIETQARLRRGEGTSRALQAGGFALDRIIRTQVQDAGRVADGVAAVGRHRVTGYYRHLVTPSCSRCVILAGKFFRTNTGFQRHPRCDCTHVPGTKDTGEPIASDPRAYFESLGAEQQDKIFTKAGAEAIRDGADINQVVNARRGMTAAGTTREGTTRRGLAGKRFAESGDTFSGDRTSRFRRTTGARLMPEEIYRMAPSRAEARDLLVAHGYLL